MEALRIKIFITRVKIYLLEKINFLPQNMRDRIAKKIFNDIKVINNEMKYRGII